MFIVAENTGSKNIEICISVYTVLCWVFVPYSFDLISFSSCLKLIHRTWINMTLKQALSEVLMVQCSYMLVCRSECGFESNWTCVMYFVLFICFVFIVTPQIQHKWNQLWLSPKVISVVDIKIQLNTNGRLEIGTLYVAFIMF